MGCTRVRIPLGPPTPVHWIIRHHVADCGRDAGDDRRDREITGPVDPPPGRGHVRGYRDPRRHELSQELPLLRDRLRGDGHPVLRIDPSFVSRSAAVARKASA